MFAAMMHPGAERLVLFHVIASGRCWVALPGGERYWASAGEVIVLPYGDEFLMGGVEAATPVHITSVVPMPPWTEMPVVRYGGGGDRTDVVCGCLYSEDPLLVRGSAGGRARKELVRREHRIRTGRIVRQSTVSQINKAP
jgi:hypothetical protein